MAYSNFVPEVWANELMTQRERQSVFRGLTYKGPILNEIKRLGDVLHIAGVGRPTVETYTRGSTITRSEMSDYQQELHITEAKYIYQEVNDIDDAQAAGKIMPIIVKEAKRALAENVDDFIADYYAQAGATVTEEAFNSGKALGVVTEAMQNLLEANVPLNEEKFLVVSPRVYQKLAIAQVVFRQPTGGVFETGEIGEYLGFRVFMSNAINNNGSTTDYCMAFTRQAIAFAEQIPASKIEFIRPHDDFCDAFKCFHLFGGTVIRPDELVRLDLTIADES